MHSLKLATSLAVLAALAACGDNGNATEAPATESTAAATDAATGTGGTTGTPMTSTAPTTGGPGTAIVVINEITSGGAVSGTYAGKGDLIELYNAGDAQADLSGFRLSDDVTLPADKTFVFADGLVLAPGGWLVLTEQDAMGNGDFPFGLAQDQEETVVLVDGGGDVVDSVTFDGAAAVLSYCRVPDGEGAWVKCDQTFEAANTALSNTCGDGVVGPLEQCDGADLGGQTCETLKFMSGTLACRPDCTRDTSGCDGGSQVVINELETNDDQIELYNAGDAAVDIAGWILTDEVSGPDYDPMADLEKLQFAAPTSIQAKGFLLVPKGMLAGQHLFGLGADGETVTLLRKDLTVADQVTYGLNEAVISYCRLPDGPGGDWKSACKPTFGAPNQ